MEGIAFKVTNNSLGGIAIFSSASSVGTGVRAEGGNMGVFGRSIMGVGVEGVSDSGSGVVGFSDSLNGVEGHSGNGRGVAGLGFNGTGVYASSVNGTGVYGVSVFGLAGDFLGNVNVSGTLNAGAKNFKIDHPLDPENKYLYHTSVESPDMKNIYDGVTLLDENGEAMVTLPEWFEALNRDFRYQLTAIGAPGPNLYVARKMKMNQFKIAGGKPGMEVSWQITGIRHDAYANTHRLPVEEEKSEKERGYYLHPDLFGQPEEKSVQWAQQPELMHRMKEERERQPELIRRLKEGLKEELKEETKK